MAHRENVPVLITCKIDGIDSLVAHMAQSITTIAKVQKVLRDHGKICQARAVHNVSGNNVTFDGKTWIINRQTGKLARSIQVVQSNPLAVVVEASAEYAGDVELGTRGPVDLKLTKLAGKIVPIVVTKAKAKAIKAAGGKVSAKKQIASTGKVMGTKYIMFRRVPGPGGKGWIIPQRPGRPFMAEAGAYTAPLLAEAISKAFAEHLTEP